MRVYINVIISPWHLFWALISFVAAVVCIAGMLDEFSFMWTVLLAYNVFFFMYNVVKMIKRF